MRFLAQETCLIGEGLFLSQFPNFKVSAPLAPVRVWPAHRAQMALQLSSYTLRWQKLTKNRREEEKKSQGESQTIEEMVLSKFPQEPRAA
jgi:hypothetical protein